MEGSIEQIHTRMSRVVYDYEHNKKETFQDGDRKQGIDTIERFKGSLAGKTLAEFFGKHSFLTAPIDETSEIQSKTGNNGTLMVRETVNGTIRQITLYGRDEGPTGVKGTFTTMEPQKGRDVSGILLDGMVVGSLSPSKGITIPFQVEVPRMPW